MDILNSPSAADVEEVATAIVCSEPKFVIFSGDFQPYIVRKLTLRRSIAETQAWIMIGASAATTQSDCSLIFELLGGLVII